jgi:hypothetical protein
VRRHQGSFQSLLWALACTLVLKAGVPLFAAGAAHLQGLPVGSICSLNGVTLPSARADAGAYAHHHGHHGDSSSDDAPSHSRADGQHCALTGLAAMAAWHIVPLASHVAAAAAQPPRGVARPCAVDACASWAARMQHPPPSQPQTAALLG